MQISRTSALTGNTHVMDLPVTMEQMLAYAQGELLQVAFPQLSADQREFVKTGITPEEWDAVFG